MPSQDTIAGILLVILVVLMLWGFGLEKTLVATELTNWVTASAARLVGSLFAALFGIGLSELGWRLLRKWWFGPGGPFESDQPPGNAH